jgi:hypothetical protein
VLGRELHVIVQVGLLHDPSQVVRRHLAPRRAPVLTEQHAGQERWLHRPGDEFLDGGEFQQLAQEEGVVSGSLCKIRDLCTARPALVCKALLDRNPRVVEYTLEA